MIQEVIDASGYFCYETSKKTGIIADLRHIYLSCLQNAAYTLKHIHLMKPFEETRIKETCHVQENENH